MFFHRSFHSKNTVSYRIESGLLFDDLRQDGAVGGFRPSSKKPVKRILQFPA